MTPVDVVVPVHGDWPMVRSCIEHLLDQIHPVRIIVVDDVSPDDTPERIETTFPGVMLLRQVTNRGYGAACNRGIAAGSGEFVVILNSDVDADPGLVRELVTALESDQRVGSAAALLRRPDESVDSFGLTADRTMAGFVRWVGVAPEAADPDDPLLMGPYGAAAGYRRTALLEAGGFDENIFMYGEELDLGLRMRALGWTSRPVRGASGVHLGSATVGSATPRQRYLGGFARGYLLRVYGVLRTRWSVRAVATEIVASAFALFRFGDTAGIRGRLAGWRAGRGVAPRARPEEGIDRSIGFATSLRMRRASYWARRA